jgi:hypothetical protein|tara:strand:+ start:225 stop:869 length:645 start_codon:yes stop_codon:yes gene_type:complete
MKVKIKKQGKKETYNTINSWSDVTLEKFAELTELSKGSKSKEAEETLAALSDMPRKLIKELSLRDVSIILGKMAELQGEQETILKKTIEIDGKEYGMHPDLSEITLGEYADIETLIKEGIEDNLPELMAILFRPITAKGESKDVYDIEAYDGKIKIRAEVMKKMSAEQVQSALVFFYGFGMVFLQTMRLYSMEQKQEMKTSQMEILPKSGDGSE